MAELVELSILLLENALFHDLLRLMTERRETRNFFTMQELNLGVSGVTASNAHALSNIPGPLYVVFSFFHELARLAMHWIAQ